MNVDDLKKQAQALLAEAHAKLKQAAKLAEQGGFNISFRAGGTYVPSAAFDKERLRREAIELLTQDEPGFAEMSADQQEDYIHDCMRELQYESKPWDYVDSPGWWQPSRNC